MGQRVIRLSLRRRRTFRQVPFVALGAGLVTACHQAALAQQSATQSSGSAPAGSFDLWSAIGSRLQQFGPAGFLVLGLLAFLGWVVSQAGNLEKVIGWFRGREQAKPAPDPSPPTETAAGRDQADVANVSGTGNVVVSGQGNQVLSGVTAGGDVVLGNLIPTDISERPTLPKGQTPHNLPSTRTHCRRCAWQRLRGARGSAPETLRTDAALRRPCLPHRYGRRRQE